MDAIVIDRGVSGLTIPQGNWPSSGRFENLLSNSLADEIRDAVTRPGGSVAQRRQLVCRQVDLGPGEDCGGSEVARRSLSGILVLAAYGSAPTTGWMEILPSSDRQAIQP